MFPFSRTGQGCMMVQLYQIFIKFVLSTFFVCPRFGLLSKPCANHAIQVWCRTRTALVQDSCRCRTGLVQEVAGYTDSL